MVMKYTTKIGGNLRPVNTLTVSTGDVPVVHDEATRAGARIPSADLHARRIAREAERWIRFATERTTMRPDTVLRKGLDACAFSVQHRASSSLALPSKMAGVREHQRVLWGMVQDHVPQWTELAIGDGHAGGLVVSYEMEPIGEVQPKHVPWLRPLVPFGARIYLSKITGHEREGYWLGCNVVFGHVGAALDALTHALDGNGADGIHAGDHGPGAPPDLSVPGAFGEGDGACVSVLPEDSALRGDPADVVLWRDAGGVAHASVPHVVRHSPSGLEWGYGGSGPADLARSILLAFTDEDAAGRLYQHFKTEVVARVPEAGGVIPAASVRRWLAQRGAAVNA